MIGGCLVLVRHGEWNGTAGATILRPVIGESEYNLKNIFTGWSDPNLTARGMEEALACARALKENDFDHFDMAFTSTLVRTEQSLNIILKEIGQPWLPTCQSQALNERNYGELTGLDKDEARQKFGEKQVREWRRSYDIAPPGGESLKLTAERTIPFLKHNILPLVLKGQNVLVVAHGNSLRSIIMYLDHLTPEQVVELEIATGVALYYRLDGSPSRTHPDALVHSSLSAARGNSAKKKIVTAGSPSQSYALLQPS